MPPPPSIFRALLLGYTLCFHLATATPIFGQSKPASTFKCPDNAFTKPWPRTVYGPASPKVTLIQKATRPGRYVFESDHYRFISNEKLATTTVRQFATLFEATYAYNMALPLNVPGRYYNPEYKFTIYLFGKYKDYVRSGGPPGSAGAYILKNNIIIVPLISLGVRKKGSRWTHIKGGENMVLAHEITHQLMGVQFHNAWYIEGFAEYIAATRYTHAAFHVFGNQQRVFDSVISKKASKASISRKIGHRVKLPHIQAFMNLSYPSFSRPDQVNRNYGIALLLTYYFYHIEGSGNAHNIKNYVKALQRGENEFEAQKLLLNGRSFQTLEKDFAKFCGKNGLAIEFQSSD